MKKLCVVLMLSVLVLYFSAELKAQDECFKEEGMNFYLNAGILTDDSFSFSPLLWYVGPSLDIHFGRIFMLSPEVNWVFYKFEFKDFLLNPAVVLNAKLKCFFVGAGISKYWYIGSSTSGEFTDFLLRLNLGIKTGNVKLRFFLDTAFNNFFNNPLIGFQLGIGF